MAKRGRWLPRLCVAVVLLLALGLAAWHATSLSGEEVRALLQGAGPWAPVIYVVSFALLEPFGVFGVFFVGPGSLLWEWPTLFALSWLGAVGAGIVGFVFARLLARDQVRSRIPERLRAYEDRLERSPLLGVILVRLAFFLWPPAHWLLGLSRVRFGTFVLGSMIGFAPGMAVFTWLGKSLVEEVTDFPLTGIAAVLVALLLGLFFRRWLRSRRREEAPA